MSEAVTGYAGNKKRAENGKRNKGPKDGQAKRGKKPFKKGKKKPLPVVKREEPVFLYVCDCHGERAEKVPCERKPEDSAEGKFSASPLGTWHCSITRKKCKVQRRKPVVEETAAE